MKFKIKVLHLCSAYVQSNLYSELIKSLDKLGIRQEVYIPIKKKQDYDKKILKNLNNTNFIYSKIFNDIDRLFYNHKTDKILDDIKKQTDFNNIKIIHAHTLFSMGGIALKLKKEKNIDYIVAIRNTDVNLFFKYMLHIRKIGINIMEEAKKIIFISPAYKEFVINRYIPYKLRDYINQKSIIVPNGINHFWLQNKYTKFECKGKKEINLIYVGDFSKNKNIDTSINVAKELKELGYNVNFTIVGDGGGYEDKTKKLAKINKDIVKLYARIDDREKLLNMYRKSDIFIMPSFHETFGLVYAEAMSQGLPILYTKGQGIDEYFKDGTVGYSVNPKNVNDIVKKIEMTIHNYNRISKNCYNLVDNFSWDKIAKIYQDTYTSIL